MLPGALAAAALGGAAGSEEFARYAVGTQAAAAYLLLAAAGVRVLYPRFCLNAGRGGRPPAGWLVAHGVFMLGSLAVLVAAGSLIVAVVLGPAYRGALAPMLVLLAGAGLTGVGLTAAAWLVAAGREGAVLRGQLCGVGAAALGCRVGGPVLDADAAAIVLCVASGATTAVVVLGMCLGAPRGRRRYPDAPA
jgi:O-antigen/teichoic acid export membrane protein